MDYSWITELTNMANSTNIFTATILGAKSLAISILGFQIFSTFLTTSEGAEPPKLGGLINLAGFALIIAGSDWIVTAIESAFSGVDLKLSSPSADPVDGIKKYMLALEQGVDEMDIFDKIGFYVSNLPLYVCLGLMTFTYDILKVLDLAVVGMYLIQRVFLIQLFRVIFPFAIAFSTFKGSDMLFRWIKIYTGLFFLGIAYAGVIKFSNMMFNFIQGKVGINYNAINYDTGMDLVFMYTIGALLISFLIKLSLLSIVTKEVRGFFS